MKLKTLLLICVIATIDKGNAAGLSPVIPSTSDLVFPVLASSWDEGMPLGNATVGALVWKKGSSLRFSLDCADLWDSRSVDSLSGANYRFSWVKEQIRKKDYLPVQKKFEWIEII